MNIERAQVGWGFWLLWVLASFVGLVGSLYLFTLYWFQSFAFVIHGPPTATYIITGAVLGFLVGGAQGLVLSRYVGWAGLWVLATTVGFAVVSIATRGWVERNYPQYAELLLVIWGAAVVSTVSAAITGGALVWLLRQPVTEEPSLPQDAE